MSIKKRTPQDDIRAMKKIARMIGEMSTNGQTATIFWLADYFLGIKLWRF